ncbi:MAG TPA: ankyrin repeat domain-containing protein [Candidatus Bathyarchaeia archaeon]|nr:ankyrin repeat domain-containing protein [Candidatus Bathyarchaeia archaeon]
MLSIRTDEFLECVQKGDLAKVKEMLARNPELADSKTRNGVSSILQAFYYGRPEIARTIADKKRELDVFEASVLGRLDRVKILTKQNYSLIDSYSPDGFPVLALAAYLGQDEVTEYLISQGANVNAVAKNPTGFTALTGAVANDHTEISKLLIQHGANVNHRYEDGASPLMEAAMNGNLELVNFFIKHGAEINVKTKDGKSPLSLASEKQHVAVIEALRKNGAI